MASAEWWAALPFAAVRAGRVHADAATPVGSTPLPTRLKLCAANNTPSETGASGDFGGAGGSGGGGRAVVPVVAVYAAPRVRVQKVRP